jgi:hypothetical protein
MANSDLLRPTISTTREGKTARTRTGNDRKCTVTGRWPEIETIYRVDQELLSRIAAAIALAVRMAGPADWQRLARFHWRLLLN